jgi:hypothetical protein
MFDSVPNLDNLDQNALVAFHAKYHRPTPQDIKSLLGEDPGPNPFTTTKQLAAYAFNRATALRLRDEGAEDKALSFEDQASKIYDRLPVDIRW